MDSLVYLVYSPANSVDQLTFSVMSARRLLPSADALRVLVFTDDPTALDDLEVQTVTIAPAVLEEWAGAHRYIHRRKLLAIKQALQQFGGRVLYCDTDTYFRLSPLEVFKRIGRGHTLTHLCEGYLHRAKAGDLAAFVDTHELKALDGSRWGITAATRMFNGGVVGLDAADAALLDEAVHLVDQLYPRLRLHTIDQFAVGACLSRRTSMQACDDAIYHYWPQRPQFADQLAIVLHDPSLRTDEERWRRLEPHLPTQDQRVHNCWPSRWPERLRIELRDVAKRTGLLGPLRNTVAVGRRLRGSSRSISS
ncbi:MAG TPA: hypothetical protein VFV95_15890 [Vicinamibacterales bacterium]|nr:hypothetical protein [Vicinamibacterales bacterium]